jgi:hypothetical protein
VAASKGIKGAGTIDQTDTNPVISKSTLFVIPAISKRESSKSDEHFNFFTNEPSFMSLYL